MTTELLAHPRAAKEPAAYPAWNRWTEAICLVSAAAVFLLLANWTAFSTPFFAENFQHLGPFRQLGNCLACTLTTPTIDKWFRPVDAFLSVISFQLFGLDPLAHHLRNYLLLLVNLFLLHQFLWEFIPGRLPRLLAVAFAAVAKANFTTIGYVNAISAILEATWILLASLFFLQFVRQGGRWRYALAILASVLSIFTKEMGISVLVVLAAIILAFARPTQGLLRFILRWTVALAPVALAVAALFIIRSFIAGGVFQTKGGYALGLSLQVFLRDGLAFGAALANISFSDYAVMGNGGLASLVAAGIGLGPALAYAADALVWLGLALVVGLIGRRSRLARRQWVLPAAWMAAVLGMVIAVRSLQLYYTYEFVLAFSILFAILLVGAARPAYMMAAGAIVVIGLNGLVSNATTTYFWQKAASDAEAVTARVAALCRPADTCRHLVFVTSDISYWQYALGSVAPNPPMLPELLRQPDLTVQYVSPAALADDQALLEPATLVIDVDHQFTPLDPTRIVPGLKLTIIAFGPNPVRAGLLFNGQPGGMSALWIQARGATSDTVVVFGGTPLPSVVGPGLDLVTAVVPPDLYSRAGQIAISLRNASGQSNTVELEVLP